MGRFLKDARHHVERIQYYHENAPFRGYAQAYPHYSKLDELILRAEKSKSDKRDVPVIQELRESVSDLMEEMRKRDGVEE
jgi:hypothetical protein